MCNLMSTFAVKIGIVLWHQSCPGKETDGACVRITRERATAAL